MLNRRIGIVGMAVALLGALGSAATAGLNHVIQRHPGEAMPTGSRTRQSVSRCMGRNPKRTTPAAQRRAARKRRNIRKHPRCAR